MPIEPSSSEEEYFKREELEKLKRLRKEAARDMEGGERERLKKLHWMRCPKCGMELAEVHYRDVAVDTCVACGGMFLDKGEVEKILEFTEPGWLKRMTSTLLGSEKSSTEE